MITPAAFIERLNAESDSDLLPFCLRESFVPFVFNSNNRAWGDFQENLKADLNAPNFEIRIVGSGRLGFSLAPNKQLKAFSAESDIDVVVIDADLFDKYWNALLEAAYPRPPTSGRLGTWLGQRRNEIYTGWITPVEIKIDRSIFGPKCEPLVELRTNWFNALKSASKHPLRRHEDITGRVYRTWRHAERYHLSSISALRSHLEKRAV